MLRVEDLHKAFVTDDGAFHALRGVSITVEQGQFFTLLGPSGCGKTTALHCIAGLETPDAGEIELAGETVFSGSRNVDVPTHRRDLGIVFQSYAIWPHMTVYENVAFPLRHGHRRGGDVHGRVMRALALVKLDHLADRPTPYLSGGQQQRVALARALVHEPPLLLLDEPLSNLDAKLREEMRAELRQITASLGMTVVYVTHDQIEALAMSDRIALMRDGTIVQEGTPREIYFRPRSAFVADFFAGGNIVPGRLVERTSSGGAGIVTTALGQYACALPTPLQNGSKVDLVIRAEGFRLCDPAVDPTDAPNRINAKVEDTIFLGSSVEARLRAGEHILRVRLDPLVTLPSDGSIRLEVLADRCAAVPASDGESP
ncbi:MAG: ABC transporter ATP-binding protein [Acetobacteraceae bacterium]